MIGKRLIQSLGLLRAGTAALLIQASRACMEAEAQPSHLPLQTATERCIL